MSQQTVVQALPSPYQDKSVVIPTDTQVILAPTPQPWFLPKIPAWENHILDTEGIPVSLSSNWYRWYEFPLTQGSFNFNILGESIVSPKLWVLPSGLVSFSEEAPLIPPWESDERITPLPLTDLNAPQMIGAYVGNWTPGTNERRPTRIFISLVNANLPEERYIRIEWLNFFAWFRGGPNFGVDFVPTVDCVCFQLRMYDNAHVQFGGKAIVQIHMDALKDPFGRFIGLQNLNISDRKNYVNVYFKPQTFPLLMPLSYPSAVKQPSVLVGEPEYQFIDVETNSEWQILERNGTSIRIDSYHATDDGQYAIVVERLIRSDSYSGMMFRLFSKEQDGSIVQLRRMWDDSNFWNNIFFRNCPCNPINTVRFLPVTTCWQNMSRVDDDNFVVADLTFLQIYLTAPGDYALLLRGGGVSTSETWWTENQNQANAIMFQAQGPISESRLEVSSMSLKDLGSKWEWIVTGTFMGRFGMNTRFMDSLYQFPDITNPIVLDAPEGETAGFLIRVTCDPVIYSGYSSESLQTAPPYVFTPWTVDVAMVFQSNPLPSLTTHEILPVLTDPVYRDKIEAWQGNVQMTSVVKTDNLATCCGFFSGSVKLQEDLVLESSFGNTGFQPLLATFTTSTSLEIPMAPKWFIGGGNDTLIDSRPIQGKKLPFYQVQSIDQSQLFVTLNYAHPPRAAVEEVTITVFGEPVKFTAKLGSRQTAVVVSLSLDTGLVNLVIVLTEYQSTAEIEEIPVLGSIASSPFSWIQLGINLENGMSRLLIISPEGQVLYTEPEQHGQIVHSGANSQGVSSVCRNLDALGGHYSVSEVIPLPTVTHGPVIGTTQNDWTPNDPEQKVGIAFDYSQEIVIESSKDNMDYGRGTIAPGRLFWHTQPPAFLIQDWLLTETFSYPTDLLPEGPVPGETAFPIQLSDEITLILTQGFAESVIEPAEDGHLQFHYPKSVPRGPPIRFLATVTISPPQLIEFIDISQTGTKIYDESQIIVDPSKDQIWVVPAVDYGGLEFTWFGPPADPVHHPDVPTHVQIPNIWVHVNGVISFTLDKPISEEEFYWPYPTFNDIRRSPSAVCVYNFDWGPVPEGSQIYTQLMNPDDPSSRFLIVQWQNFGYNPEEPGRTTFQAHIYDKNFVPATPGVDPLPNQIYVYIKDDSVFDVSSDPRILAWQYVFDANPDIPEAPPIIEYNNVYSLYTPFAPNTTVQVYPGAPISLVSDAIALFVDVRWTNLRNASVQFASQGVLSATVSNPEQPDFFTFPVWLTGATGTLTVDVGALNILNPSGYDSVDIRISSLKRYHLDTRTDTSIRVSETRLLSTDAKLGVGLDLESGFLIS